MKKLFIITTVFLLVFSGFAQNSATTASGENNLPDGVYHVKDLDKKPHFKGGHEALMKFIKSKAEVPQELKNYKGITVVGFIIEENGKITDPKVVKSCGNEDLDKVAVETIKKMPNWLPGIKDGKKVKTLMRLPVPWNTKLKPRNGKKHTNHKEGLNKKSN